MDGVRSSLAVGDDDPRSKANGMVEAGGGGEARRAGEASVPPDEMGELGWSFWLVVGWIRVFVRPLVLVLC
jgi:hypothetical protein